MGASDVMNIGRVPNIPINPTEQEIEEFPDGTLWLVVDEPEPEEPVGE